MALMIRIYKLCEKVLTSIKMRISAIFLRIYRFIYTKIYCRSLVNKAKNGFGIIKKRKEFKNEQETYQS